MVIAVTLWDWLLRSYTYIATPWVSWRTSNFMNSPLCSFQRGSQLCKAWRPADFEAAQCYLYFCRLPVYCRNQYRFCVTASLWHFWSGWWVRPARLPPRCNPPSAHLSPPGFWWKPELTDFFQVKCVFCWNCPRLPWQEPQHTLYMTCLLVSSFSFSFSGLPSPPRAAAEMLPVSARWAVILKWSRAGGAVPRVLHHTDGCSRGSGTVQTSPTAVLTITLSSTVSWCIHCYEIKGLVGRKNHVIPRGLT